MPEEIVTFPMPGQAVIRSLARITRRKRLEEVRDVLTQVSDTIEFHVDLDEPGGPGDIEVAPSPATNPSPVLVH